ncbi:MAG: hypothetical protein U5L74_09515 [Ideonella sp.]|nr:hypothetical protein [Ideonella sp.]
MSVLYATEVVSDHAQGQEGLQKPGCKDAAGALVQLNERGSGHPKPGTKLDDLVAQANAKTDLQAAQEMQKGQG